MNADIPARGVRAVRDVLCLLSTPVKEKQEQKRKLRFYLLMERLGGQGRGASRRSQDSWFRRLLEISYVYKKTENLKQNGLKKKH